MPTPPRSPCRARACARRSPNHAPEPECTPPRRSQRVPAHWIASQAASGLPSTRHPSATSRAIATPSAGCPARASTMACSSRTRRAYGWPGPCSSHTSRRSASTARSAVGWDPRLDASTIAAIRPAYGSGMVRASGSAGTPGGATSTSCTRPSGSRATIRRGRRRRRARSSTRATAAARAASTDAARTSTPSTHTRPSVARSTATLSTAITPPPPRSRPGARSTHPVQRPAQLRRDAPATRRRRRITAEGV